MGRSRDVLIPNPAEPALRCLAISAQFVISPRDSQGADH